MTLELRPYQETARAEVSAAMRAGCKRPLLVLPTGAGKTAIATDMLRRSIARGFGPCWFMVHRKELLRQTAEAFAKADLSPGIVATGYPTEGSRAVQTVLIGSLARRAQYLAPPRVIIVDECHHAVAASWRKVQEQYPDAFYIGLSASPQRLDRRGLGDHFDKIIEGPQMRWLIDNGYLSDFRIFAPPPPDLSQVGHVAGEFNQGELAEVLAKSTIVGDSIREYEKHAAGKRTLIRCVSVDASKAACEMFRSAGYAAVHIDAKTPEGERVRLFESFKRGDVSHLFNVDLFGEGVSIDGIECLIDLRPTESLTMYLQFVGRLLRFVPGKVGIYLDQVGNTARHGFPDDVREWSLDGKRAKKKPAKIFTCKACYGAFAQPFRYCPVCGEAVAGYTGARADPQRVEGELTELTRDKMPPTSTKKGRVYDADYRSARTLEQLISYARDKQYKSPERWAMHVFDARQKKATAAA